MRKVFEGIARYGNEANDFFHEWASIEIDTENYDFLDMIENMMGDKEWQNKKIRITVEIVD